MIKIKSNKILLLRQLKKFKKREEITEIIFTK
jgi:hypothetical protein